VHKRITQLWNTLAAIRGTDRKGWRRVPSEYLAVMAQIRHEVDGFVRLTEGAAAYPAITDPPSNDRRKRSLPRHAVGVGRKKEAGHGPRP
jgi:hypothetical protein